MKQTATLLFCLFLFCTVDLLLAQSNSGKTRAVKEEVFIPPVKEDFVSPKNLDVKSKTEADLKKRKITTDSFGVESLSVPKNEGAIKSSK